MTVPFALTAGLSSLGTSKLVVYGGIAELIAGTISMGVGGFRESKSGTGDGLIDQNTFETKRILIIFG